MEVPCEAREAGLDQEITLVSHDPGTAPSQLCLRLEDGRALPIDRRLVVGSAPGNDVVLRDRMVSGEHCAFEPLGPRTLVRDLGSRNGCWLGPARVRVAELTAGARLTVGRTTLLVDRPAVEDDGMVGASPVLARLRSELARAAPTQLPILLLGESGTGKELAARRVHAEGRRRGPLVAVNCGALAPEIVESELFGHEKGAFTGASGRRIGLFEEADRGTLFLDEIGELPRALQPKLLRALETGRVRPVGAAAERTFDVRIVSATHRELAAAVDSGEFRLDLYHRLSAIEIRLPALRERPEDIPVLARFFLEDSGAGGPSRSFSEEALHAMSRHTWPGNVRELRNAVTRAAHLAASVIGAADLFPHRPRGGRAPEVAPGPEEATPRRMADLQRQAIVQALSLHGGNVRAAARWLGMPTSTLHDRVRRWALR